MGKDLKAYVATINGDSYETDALEYAEHGVNIIVEKTSTYGGHYNVKIFIPYTNIDYIES